MELRVALTGAFLAGGPFEFDPFLAVHFATSGGASPSAGTRYAVVLTPDATAAAAVADWEHASAPSAAPWLRAPEPSDLAMVLPPAHAPLDDDGVVLTLYANTREAGVPNLAEPITRDSAIASATVPLAQLLAAATSPTGTLEVPLTDDIYYKEMMRRGLLASAKGDTTVFNDPVAALGEARVTEINTMAYNAATKGRARLGVAGALDRPAIAAFLRARARLPSTARISSTAAQAMGAQALASLEEKYWKVGTDLAPPADMSAAELAEVRMPADPRSPLMTNLYMSRYTTAAGDLPPYAFVLHDALQSPDPEVRAAAPPIGDAGYAQMRGMLMSALLANGMRPAYFESVVAKQLAMRTEDTLQSSFVTALAVVADMATFTANTLDYKGDNRYGNTAYLKSLTPEQLALFAPPPPPGTAPVPVPPVGAVPTRACADPVHAAHLFERHVMQAAFTHIVQTHVDRARLASGLRRRVRYDAFYSVPLPAALAPPPPPAHPDEALIRKMRFDCESWDKPDVAGHSYDCEDVATGCTKIVDVTAQVLRAAPLALLQQDSLLSALHDTLGVVHAHMIGGTVSEPFVDARASKTPDAPTVVPAPPPPPPAHRALPLIGSPEAAAMFAGEGGHGYAMVEGRAIMARHYLNGITLGKCNPEDAPRLRAHWQGVIARAAPWEKRLPTQLMEGTGAVNAQLFNVFAGTDRADVMTRKMKARILFARALRNKETPELAAVADVVRLQTQAHEWEVPADPKQMVSGFYSFLGHSVCPATVTQGAPTYGHTLVCDTATGKRGVPIGDYVRASMRPDSTVALVSPYAHYLTTAQWDRTVAPYVARVLGQQPTSSFLRRAFAAPHAVAQPIPAAALTGLAGTPLTHAATAARLDQLCGGGGGNLAGGAPLAASVVALGRNLGAIETADERDDVAILQMYVPAWKFATMAAPAIARVTGALDTLKAQGRVGDYVLLRDQGAMPMSNPGFRLLVTLPVPAQ